MDALGQDHPAWIQEGLACLFEAWSPGSRDAPLGQFLPNDRDDAARALALQGDLLEWPEIISMSASSLGAEASRSYPQLRSMMRFLDEAAPGGVVGWYARYVEGFDGDPGGTRSLEAAFGSPLAEAESRWRIWVLEGLPDSSRVD
jgi:hypothetical protein